jgi:hypothetical protein
MMKAVHDVDPWRVTVDVSAMAEACEISDRHMRRILDQQHVSRSHGKVELLAGLRGYVRALKGALGARPQSEAAARAEEAKARLLELQIAERDGRLMDLREAQDIIAELCGTFRSGLEGLPARLTPDLSFRAKIEGEISEVFATINARIQQAAGLNAPGAAPGTTYHPGTGNGSAAPMV